MAVLPESELVLNADGSIYHLGLFPEEVASTILTVGDPGRVARISQHFDRVEVRRQKREFHTHTGILNGRRLSVISTGIGPDNIDIVLNELDALVNIDLVSRQIRDKKTVLNLIRVGTSGGLQADLPPESLVAAVFGLGLDNLGAFYTREPGDVEREAEKAIQSELDLPVTPSVFAGSEDLLKIMGKNMAAGLTMTAPGFYGPQGRSLRLTSTLDEQSLRALADFRFHGLRILNVEMETSALYGLAGMLGHRALSCNTILANRPKGTFTKAPKKAVDKLIEEVLERISTSDFFLKEGS